MKDNELDELFRSKLGEREFEFNPRNWQAMESMLDEPVRNSSFFIWSTLSILTFGLLVSGSILMNRNTVNISENSGTEKIIRQNINLSNSDDRPFSGDDENSSTDGESVSPPIEILAEDSADDGIVSSVEKQKDPDPANITDQNSSRQEVQEEKPVYNSSPGSTRLTDDKPNGYFGTKGLPALHFGIMKFPIKEVTVHQTTFRPGDPAKFRMQHELWFQAGPDFSLSNANSPTSTSWFAGFNYRYRFSKHWNINAGLNYFARRSPGIYLTSDSIFYNFGQEVIRTEVENQRLDYISIPVEISYDINARHQVNAGAYTAILVNVQRHIKQTHFHFKQGAEITEMEENGGSVNFRKMDYGLSLGYNFQYSAQLGVGVQLKYGLTDITRDRMKVLNDHHQNINARIVLRYRIF